MEPKVEHQGLHCLVCEDYIFSESVHDYKHCTCGHCFVDGGKEYFRYGYFDPEFVQTAYRLDDGTIV